MYIQTQRKITDREAKKLGKRLSALKDELRGAPKTFSCCLGCSAPFGVVIILLNHGAPYFWFEFLMGFVILAAIAASVGLESTQKIRGSIRSLESALENGSAVEHHIAASRCFMVEGDDEGSDYYFDVGEQGTIVVSDLDISSRRFPSSDLTVVYLLNGQGKQIDVICRCSSNRLSPVTSISRDHLWNSPDLERYTRVETFTVFSEDFDSLLRKLNQPPH